MPGPSDRTLISLLASYVILLLCALVFSNIKVIIKLVLESDSEDVIT